MISVCELSFVLVAVILVYPQSILPRILGPNLDQCRQFSPTVNNDRQQEKARGISWLVLAQVADY
jgi:hypothetical protein